MLNHAELQYIRDTIKETIEAQHIEDVEDELLECLELLEGVL